MRKLIKRFLNWALFRLNRDELTERHTKRKELLTQYVYETLLQRLPDPTTAICFQDSRINLYPTPDGIPIFDFMIPRKNLFIRLLDWRDCDMTQATSWGLDISDWEAYQESIGSYIANFPLSDEDKRLVLIRWNQNLTPQTLEAIFNNV